MNKIIMNFHYFSLTLLSLSLSMLAILHKEQKKVNAGPHKTVFYHHHYYIHYLPMIVLLPICKIEH